MEVYHDRCGENVLSLNVVQRYVQRLLGNTPVKKFLASPLRRNPRGIGRRRRDGNALTATPHLTEQPLSSLVVKVEAQHDLDYRHTIARRAGETDPR